MSTQRHHGMSIAAKCFARSIAIASALLFTALANAGVKIEHWIAPSGARVYFVEIRTLPILDVQVDFTAGGTQAPAAKAGLASLTTGLLDAGVDDAGAELNEEQIAGRWVDLGAMVGASAEQDRASISLRTLSSAPEMDGSVALLSKILARPTFPQEVLQREKQRSIAAIRESDTRPAAIASRRFAALMYPHHPYGVLSTAETVASVERADLIAFHRAHYGAKGASVSIVGDVSRQEAEAIAQRLTAALPAGDVPNPVPSVTMPVATVVNIAHPAGQSHIRVGVPAVRRGDVDFFPLMVGNYTLGGGGFASRLVHEIRDNRGLAYSVSSSFSPRKLEGPFEISLQTKRDQSDVALKLVNQVVTDYVTAGPTPTELAAAKKNLVDGFGLRLDSNAKLLGNLSVIGYYQLPLTYLDEYPAKVKAVTVEQIKAAFAKHVPLGGLVTVVVATD